MKELGGRYFDVLYEVARTINSTLDAEEVLRMIVKSATEETGARGCSLLLLDADKKCLLHSSSYGLSEEYLHKGDVTADRSIADALKGEPVVVTDVSNDPRIQYPVEALKEGIGSMLCVGLYVGGTPIGVMRIYRSGKGDFSADTVKLVSAIANLSAVAIKNSRTHDSLRKAHEVCQRELWYWQP